MNLPSDLSTVYAKDSLKGVAFLWSLLADNRGCLGPQRMRIISLI